MDNFKDITGKRFCRLIVMERIENYTSPKGQIKSRWLCKCDCGNETKVIYSNLITGEVKSCGCLLTETVIKNGIISKELGKIQSISKIGQYKNTKIQQLTMKTPVTNTSGFKGVYWCENVGKWNAKIEFQKKKINLGYFKNKEDAIKARKEAERKYFKPIIEEYKQFKECELCPKL